MRFKYARANDLNIPILGQILKDAASGRFLSQHTNDIHSDEVDFLRKEFNNALGDYDRIDFPLGKLRQESVSNFHIEDALGTWGNPPYDPKDQDKLKSHSLLLGGILKRTQDGILHANLSLNALVGYDKAMYCVSRAESSLGRMIVKPSRYFSSNGIAHTNKILHYAPYARGIDAIAYNEMNFDLHGVEGVNIMFSHVSKGTRHRPIS